ncbi:MAG: DUF1465 family protein [Emcibacter sp.]|nr:DUF1465 family protein [Emcibacter sp.]
MTEKNLTKGLLDPRFLERAYQDAMILTQDVANYLDHKNKTKQLEQNKQDAKTEFNYVSESMRLSTCLMQVMAWFLVQKGVLTGEITKKQAGEEKFRLDAADICLKEINSSQEDFPPEFNYYREKSQDLYRQVERMDKMIYGKNQNHTNPVHDLIDHIHKKNSPDN